MNNGVIAKKMKVLWRLHLQCRTQGRQLGELWGLSSYAAKPAIGHYKLVRCHEMTRLEYLYAMANTKSTGYAGLYLSKGGSVIMQPLLMLLHSALKKK